jgi:hypothetical protein
MKFGLFTMPKSLLVSEPEIITKGRHRVPTSIAAAKQFTSEAA